MTKAAASLALLMLVLPASSSGATRWRALEAIPDRTPVSVLVGEHPRVYYRLDSPSGFEVDLRGPGRLKVVSRAEVEPGTATVVSYQVLLFERGAVVKQHATESSATPKASPRGGRLALCKSRSFTWAIPEGTHRVRIVARGTPSVLVRLLLSTPIAPQTMISMTPVSAPRSVTLSEGEKLLSYYSVLPGKPVRLRVVGPTSLEILSRLDFDASMRGPQPYRLAVLEPGQPPRDFQFTTTKTVAAYYTDLRDRSPSKVSRIVIAVPDGTHEYAVELKQPRNGSVEIQARIPEPTAGEEE